MHSQEPSSSAPQSARHHGHGHRSFGPPRHRHAHQAPHQSAHQAPHQSAHQASHQASHHHRPHVHQNHAPAPAPVQLAQPAQPAVDHPAPAAHQAATGVFAALIPALQRAIAEEGYTTPTPIQEQTIPHLLAGRDILGCAQTGTGKTAAFSLPMLQLLGHGQWTTSRGRPRALILAPTRELALQIGESLRAYGRHLKITHTVIFGGVGQGPQCAALARGVDIVVATPGRLLDLMQQRHVRLDGIEIFVLDEADRMLDMGFIRDIRKVIAALPPKRHSLFFSATLSEDVVALARTLVHDPVHVTVTPERPAVERIVQKVLFVEKEQKVAALVDLLRDPRMTRVLVFVRMKHAANRLVEELSRAGIRAAAIHGNKSQSARTEAMANFKSGRTAVLVATDLAARGIDVDAISHVINYDLPEDPETYVHRIGRTARAGAEGDAVSLCCPHDRDFLRAIERFIRCPVTVDAQHPRHSDNAMRATGAAARLPPRGNFRGGGGRQRQGHSHPKAAKAPFRGTRSFGGRR